MKTQRILILGMVTLFLNSCLGDRKSIIGEDLGDTSFVNKSFKNNRINFSKDMSACDKLSAAELAKLYNVNADAIIITDPTTSNRYAATPTPTCMFHVKMSDQKFDHLTGTITLFKEVSKDAFMGDVAEATGAGEDWVEAWSLKKSMYKSAEWLPNIGQAALWIGSKRTLEIKFEGYSLSIIAPGAPFNEIEKAKNRDYKSIALAIAKAAGYIN